jgi:hypothetical protein
MGRLSTDLWVGGTPCQPQAKITQQKEPPTEMMRRMYSCAVDVKVEDKSGYLERLVETSMHFRAMNVREVRSPSLSGRRLRMSRYVNGSNPWFNFIGKLLIPGESNWPELRPLPKPSEPKMVGFIRSCDRFVQGLEWRGCPGVHACSTCSPTSRKVDSNSEAELDNPFGIKCCRHDRFEMNADRSLYNRGHRFTTMIEIGCPPHSSPSFALALSLLCTPRHNTAAMLPRFFCPTPASTPPPTPAFTPPRCRRQTRSRARSQCPMPLTSPSFSCSHPFYRSSVLDLHAEAILMCTAQLSMHGVAFPLTLRRYIRLVHPRQGVPADVLHRLPNVN